MSQADIDNKRSLFERLQDNYRLVVIDDDDLKEVNTFKFNLITLYILISTLLVITGAVAIALIFFTPIKRLIPGFEITNDNSQYVELRRKVDELEELLQAQDVYNNGLGNLLQGMEPGVAPAASEEDADEETPSNVKDAVTPINNALAEEASKTKELNQFVFASPLTGTMSAKFDPDIEHFGSDITAPKNTAIKSIMGGIVISADWNVDAGNTVIIQHPRNIVSVYKHNSALLVKTGDVVKSGQAVAIIGNTGKLTNGPHLHLELWYNGYPVNPENYISFN
ncbi:MAG: M23 family metallopeptidase [Saprospiraceae bacterium]|jgi:murein DD-endopeptidase MepM/ murein hydrolase activator NlpD|nr:M23 family metallopeptidase [Saprospiraceae bacterium]MBP7644760.1 M23 family metallopeptidase [Saprospiraceae bacterium]